MAWFAGLFEGEGWFGAVRRRGRKAVYPTASLASTDEDIVRRIPVVTGLGYVNGPYRAKKSTKPHWVWRISGWENVRRLRDAIGPFLGARRAKKLNSMMAHDPVLSLPPDCSTPSRQRYLNHLRSGEPACAACLGVNAMKTKQYRAKRKSEFL